MAFLDNSGDIILDAVLTDTGRLRMAQGDGSFKITKFALGDDEINYQLYDKDHSSGSAYYDLEVLQTPVLEAFTNNTSNLKTKLVTMSRTNVLYMPILKLNKNEFHDSAAPQALGSKTFKRNGGSVTISGAALSADSGADVTDPKYYVAVDKDTYRYLAEFQKSGVTATGVDAASGNKPTGIIQGFTADTTNGDTNVLFGGSLIRH